MLAPSLNKALVAVVVTFALAGCDLPSPASRIDPALSGTGHLTDTQVTSSVLTALRTDIALQGLDIRVGTTNGDVRLSGEVERPEQIELAVQRVRRTPGAHTVNNQLSVRP